MDRAGLQQIALGAAAARSLDGVLARVVEGLAAEPGVARARIFLAGIGDRCASCPARPECPDQTICLHLAAGAGRPYDPEGQALRALPHDPEGQALRALPLSGDRERFTGSERDPQRIPLGVGRIGRVATTGEPLLIVDVVSDSGWRARPEAPAAEEVRSIAARPLLLRDEVLGVLEIQSRMPLRAEALAWLGELADQTAVAIANARAFEELARARDVLARECEYLREAARGASDPIGESPALRSLLEQIALVAPSDASVLITGEPGTGKDLVADVLHERSGRSDRVLVRVDCSARPRARLERELFGAAATAGAARERIGRFELADGGSILLDEVGALPLELQSTLLRVLQEGSLPDAAGDRGRTLDVRVIASSSRDLRADVEAGRFRAALYWRLAAFPIEVPPLRARPGDVRLLAAHFLREAAARRGRADLRLTQADLARLERHGWPGNVTELRVAIERAVVLARRSRLDFETILPRLPRAPGRRPAAGAAPIQTEAERRERERTNILAALERAQGRIYGPGGAAALLGLKPTTLASRIKALGLERAR